MLHRSARPARPVRRRLTLGLGLVVLAGGLSVAPLPAFAEESIAVVDRAPLELTPAADPQAPPISTESVTPGSDPAPVVDAAPTRVAAQQVGVDDFRLIAIEARNPSGAPAKVRVHTADGWGEWKELSFETDNGPDHGTEEEKRAQEHLGDRALTEPTFVSHADGYEVSLPAGSENAEAVLVREQTHLVVKDPTPAAGALTLPAHGQPTIRMRNTWTSRPPKVRPELAPTVRVAVVHHSVSSNTYGPDDVPGELRAIQAFHMDGRGWDDIGYNFAIDRFGRIWEGRAGGINLAVIGAHALGANYEGTGIVALGDFSGMTANQAMLDAYGQLIGWKLYIHGSDATGSAPFTLGEGAIRGGQTVDLPHVIGHQTVQETSCPGQIQGQLDTIRALAGQKQVQLKSTPGFWGAITTGINADGRLEGFAIGNDRMLYHNWQVPTGNGWSGWYQMGGPVAGRPTVAYNADGRMEVFVVGWNNGPLLHAWQYALNGTWSNLKSEGGTMSSSAGVAVARNPGGRLEAFVIGDDDQIWNLWQVAPNGGWNGWAPMGGSFPSNVSLTANLNADGRMQVFGVGDGNVLVTAWKLGTGGWSEVTSLEMPVFGDPSVATNKDGRLEAVGIDLNGDLWQVWQLSPNGSWSQPRILAQGFRSGAAATVAANQDGRLQAFGLGAAGDLRTIWQVGAGGTWGPTGSIGGALAGAAGIHLSGDGRLVAMSFTTPSLDRGWAVGQIAPNAVWGQWGVMN